MPPTALARSYKLVAVTALALLLSLVTAPAQALDPVDQAISWLRTQQRSDGSFGVGPQGSAGMTADVIYVLALVGEDPAGAAWSVNGHSALEALASLAIPYASRDAGQAGKVARAVALAGGNPRDFGGLDLIQVIQNAYDPSTGRYHAQLLFRHTVAVEGLLRSAESVPAAALDAILEAQLPDGGWFWSFDGETGEVDSTGRVMQSLAAFAGLTCAPRLQRAADFLAAGQLATGGWGVRAGEEPANANSTALAIAGLRADGSDPAAPRFEKGGLGPVQVLLSFQEPTGAFRYTRVPGSEESRLVATLDALNGLAQPLRLGAICLTRYLPMLLSSG